MAAYSGVKKEHQLKNLVFDDYFDHKLFRWEQEVDNIDFIITSPSARHDLYSDGPGSSAHYLWAEAKKGVHDVYDMLTQLVLTCRKTYEKGDYLAPPWIGCFDEVRIAFAPFHDILPVFSDAGFNWNTAPSDHSAADFQKAKEKVKNLIGAKLLIYHFESGSGEIKEFIKTRFISGASASVKSPITKDNFVQIFYKWVREVRPAISMAAEEWTEYKRAGVLEGDFYRADVMSENGNTITISDKLKIVLENDRYKVQDKNKFERLIYTEIEFRDGGEAYRQFWNRYRRPPAEVYQKYIMDRRDLLAPQNIRETKGTFFTPKIWADKSKEYLEKVFGVNWQEEYYIWDCAAGTGNLLGGLQNKYRIWASDIDQTNIDTMKAMAAIDDDLRLLEEHIFQFDFLNDTLTKQDHEWDKEHAQKGAAVPERKLPPSLCDIIDDPEKRKKLIIYINPPYSETMSKTETDKTGLNQTAVNSRYKLTMGNCANRELFVQFLTRIYFEISGCKIAVFSKLKTLNSPNFIDFRKYFSARLDSIFLCPAYTFDNVKGKFPIGFQIWNTEIKEKFKAVKGDVYKEDGSYDGEKIICSYDDLKLINEWIILTRRRDRENIIGFMSAKGNDFQNTNYVYIVNSKAQLPAPRGTWVTDKNLIEASIYLSVRHCIEPSWLNDRDQFLFPNNSWETDSEFQNDCLVFSLFEHNNIQSRYGVNHWIPFTEEEADAKDTFQSNFMSGFLKGRELSPYAQALLDKGRTLWQYYHRKIKTGKTANVNASFYDIRAHFQGRKENGTMNAKSNDKTYNAIIKDLRETLKTLSAKIEPKVYVYGFLKQ